MFVKNTAWLYNAHLEGGMLAAEDPLGGFPKKRLQTLPSERSDSASLMQCRLGRTPKVLGANAFAKTIFDVLRRLDWPESIHGQFRECKKFIKQLGKRIAELRKRRGFYRRLCLRVRI
jgi:hypothetical protein